MLGQGAYGEVNKKGNKAIKSFTKEAHLIQEYSVARYLSDCQYIVHEKGVDMKNIQLSMELYDGSLRDWLNNNRKRSAEDLTLIVTSILKGLIELHDRKLAHGDLKPGNILFTADNGQVKKVVLGDLGFVSVAKYSKMERTAALYRDNVISYSTAHDMYSFGICILEILCGIKPKHRLEYKELNKLVKEKVSDVNIKNIILKLVQADHDKRPTARETLAYFSNENFQIHQAAISEIEYKIDEIDTEIQSILYDVSKIYALKRTNQGFYALLNYFRENNKEKKDYEIYVAALIIILKSNFGTGDSKEKITYGEVKKMFDNKFSKDDINNTIIKLLNNDAFLNNIFA
jgi:serine/threonine protein kinase